MSHEETPGHEVCQGCQATLATPLFCFSCQSLQRQKPHLDFFTIFGLPHKYDVDLQKLEEIYQSLAVELHPDFYTNAPEADKRQSIESSALLNKAYTSLQSPTERASYLLNLLTDGEKFNERLLPDGFLQEMFLLQESLEELLEDDSKTSEVKRLQEDITKRLKQSNEAISGLFSSLDETPTEQESVYETIQMNLNAGRYLQRLLDRILRSEVS